MKCSGGTKIVFSTEKEIIGSINKMGITELIVIAFLAVLGFLAYNNSRKVARELRRMGADK